jgi:membrane protein implicated in regulation of membrane protease activity
MTIVYLVAAILGWPLVLFFLFAGGDDGGGDGDFDLDADADADGIGSLAGDLLSIRGIAFFLAFFGATGLVLGWLDANGLIRLLAAIGLGVFAWWLNRTLVRYLKTSSVATEMSDRLLVGLPARVTVPIDEGRKGKIVVDVQGQILTLVARPFRSGTFANDSDVVIVEIDRGIALVASLDELNR